MDFPPIDRFYEDEFGDIDPEIYRVGKEVWNSRARFFADAHLHDADEGCRLMFKTLANVSAARNERQITIDNLSVYLFVSFKNMVFAELKKSTNRRRILESLPPSELVNEENKLLQKIEVEELLQKLQPEARTIFELHYICGFGFKELVPRYGSTAEAVRSKISKALQNIRKQVSAKSEPTQK